jgi:hypothetical protein
MVLLVVFSEVFSQFTEYNLSGVLSYSMHGGFVAVVNGRRQRLSALLAATIRVA